MLIIKPTSVLVTSLIRMAMSESVGVLNVLVVEFKRLNQDAFMDLFSLHSPGFPRPRVEELWSERRATKEQRRMMVAHRYVLRHPRLHLSVTDCTVDKECLKSLVLPHFDHPDVQIHALVTLVDCRGLLESYRPDEYIAHLRSFHHLFPHLAHATIFIRAAPNSDERRTFLINLAGQDALYEDQFMFINSGESGTWRDVLRHDQYEFERLTEYLNGRTSLSVEELMRGPTGPLSAIPYDDLDIGEIRFMDLLGGLAFFIPFCIIGYFIKKMYF